MSEVVRRGQRTKQRKEDEDKDTVMYESCLHVT